MEHIRNHPGLPAVLVYKLRDQVKKLGELTYDECITLGREADDTLKHMSAFDQAVEFFIRQRIDFYKYAELLNWQHRLERDDHAEPIPVLYSLGDGKDLYEGIVYLPRYLRIGTYFNPPAGHHLHQMIIDHHNWRSLNLSQFEVVLQ